MIFSDCDPLTGACRGCLRHTTGPRCESCAPGFYGNALLPGNCTRKHNGVLDAPEGQVMCHCDQASFPAWSDPPWWPTSWPDPILALQGRRPNRTRGLDQIMGKAVGSKGLGLEGLVMGDSAVTVAPTFCRV